MRREGRANTNFEQLFPQLYTLFSGVEQDLCSEGCSRGRETQFHGSFQRNSFQAMDKRLEHGAKASQLPSNGIGSRFSNLEKSFKYSIRSLLTSCSKEEFYKAFSSFSNTEREFLHRLFLQVITSLHENLEEGFQTICLQTQAGATLDAVEEIVEEQDLDVLFSDRSNITDVSENLSMAKKKEIQHLMHMVQSGEEHNQVLRTRLQMLREDNKVLSGASQAVKKFKSMNLNYGANSGDGIHDV
ncbi:uncharacterized protein LOC114176399 isoform X3 [Vigna unguiculata]|uniref:uncharacterized protein LOC114176399 isoform X3 n=1 Tax=Vigna unguiculata TaxID=3917 RepID=UPI0010163338|nr:uncharacterized protein LOC114176399 isoform X3 [Vigna unguiculata]